MTAQTIVLFHSALGLRPAVHRFAQALRADGHMVHTPDLFDGEVYGELDDGVAKRDALGIAELSNRAMAAVQDLPPDIVHMGFSMGTGSAQFLAAMRPGAKGVVLMHGALDPAMLGMEGWQAAPTQIHYAEGDPWMNAEWTANLKLATEEQGLPCEVFAYDAQAKHLFTDEDSADYDPQAAELCLSRIRAFLSELG